jgi:hypothetical protein
MNTHTQRGSVLIYILIAVALFATLSFVVAQMIRGGGSEVSGEKSNLIADEIMSYGQTLRRGIQPMRISNGCEETDVSFEATGLTGYVNGANAGCQLFSPSGGGAVYIKPTTSYGAATDWIFTGTNIVDDVGTVAPDLVAILPDINLGVCNAINDKLGIASVGTDTAVDFTKFQGTYASSQTIDFAAGKSAGCLKYTATQYMFYQVLIGR